MHKFYKILLTLILSISIVLSCLPITAFAAEKTIENNNDSYVNNLTQETSIASEIISERDANKKVFRLEDGSYLAAIYPEPVHYKNDGIWEEIDNSFVSSDEVSNTFENKSNSFNVKFSKKSKSNKLVTLKNGSSQLKWALEGSEKVQAVLVENAKNSENISTLKNLNGTIVYENILSNTDLKYTVSSTRIKEDIIIKNKQAPESFVFNFEFKNLNYTQFENGKIEFYENDSTLPVFTLESPYMYDAAGNTSSKISITITESKKGFELTITPDKEWISNEERIFPVVIDPTILTQQDSSLIKDATGVNSVKTTTLENALEKNSNDLWLKVGKFYGVEAYSLIYIPIPPVIDDSFRIINATLNLCCYRAGLSTCPNNLTIAAYEITSDWNQNNITTNTVLYQDDLPESSLYGVDFITINDVSTEVDGQFFSFDITKAAQKWATGETVNRGIILKGLNLPSTENYIRFYDSDNSVANSDPLFTYTYRDTKGIEDYWTYTTMSAGRSGTAAVNNFNGNLVVTQNITGIGGNRLPVSISAIYDSRNRNNANFGLSKGWKTNYDMMICTSQAENYQYYLLDSDGTEHYFFGEATETEWKDEDGLGYTLTRDSSVFTNGYLIVDKGKNKNFFRSDGKLGRIEDTFENQINISYTTAGQISTITDGAGRVYTFAYNTNGFVSSITNPASKTVNFEYNSSNYLEKITYADGKATVFSYDSNGITKTTAPDGTYVKYSYDLINNHLYTKSLEYYGSNDILNTDYDFEYQHNNTIITSDCDNTINNTYQFNNFGKTTGVVNNKSGTAEYYEYGAPGGATGTENKLLGVSNTVFASASVINDNSFSNSQKFYVDPEATDTVVSVDNTKGRNNAPSLKVQQTGEYGGNTAVIYDLGTLKGGYNYTFKVHINTGDTVINGYTGISFYGFRYDAEGYKNYDFYSTSVAETFDDGWVAISVTHGFSEDTHYYLSIGGYIASPATFWIDDLQVELGDGTDNYNYLNDSAFIQGGTEWVYKRNGTVSTDSSIKYYTDVGFGINGSPNETRSCSQVASCVGNAGDVLCFGAWAVAISAPTGNGNNSTFRIRVELSGPSGNAVFTSGENILNFNFALEEWQLASKYLIAPIDFTSVTFYLDYDYNLNFALFHRPFLYKEEFGQSYSYDSNGNVVSTKDLAQTEATFAYQNNNLSQMIEPTGSRYSYSYDEQTNALMYANSSDGQLFAFTYDSFGNVLSTTATALTNATQLNTDSVYYIRNVTTGNAMKNANALLTNGTYATQNNSIRWKLVSAGETDVYYVQSFADTGKYLTVKDGSTADKAEIILSDLANSDSQKFKVSAVGDGTFKLLTKVSGYAKAIDSRDLNNGGSTELNKGMVQNAVDNTNAYQKWYFTPYVESENVQSINSSATYTADGNYLQTSTDTFGNVSSYQYNADGSVSSETNAKNVSANYTYDENSGNLLTVTSGNSTNKYTYENDRLKTIETANGTVYTFNYDAFGRNKSITLNRKNSTATDRTLVTYTYNSESYQEGFTSGSLNNISQVTYGNGATYYQSYDSVGRLGTARNTDYVYNKYNQLSLKRSTGGDWSEAYYSYDMAGRIVNQLKAMVYDGSFMYSMSFKYKDKTNLLEKYRFATAYDSLTTSFVYGDINSGQIPEAVYGVKLNGTQRLGYTYDSFARQISRTLYAGSIAIPKTYTYKMVENSTGYLVDTISEGGYTYNYSYDALGNITAYTKKNSATGQVVETAVYRYDDKNQLVFAGTSDTVGTAYTYDANGNILTKTNTATNATISYGYTDPTWADLLTSYNGQTITYDEVGNPINYRNGMTFGWAMDSRNLETVTIGENVYNYSYTGEGERAAKYVGDVSYQYKFFDGVLYGESRYDMFGETLIYYFYDENGTMYGFSYNGTPYYYRLNLQGDVTGIYNSNGQLVTEYTYDEWGKVLTVTGSMADTVGQANAIRYRGYYYDAETGFYYLQTRYYDPETGRFLNADGFISTGQGILSNNMFAYCGNNPVNNADATGTFHERTAGGFGGGGGSAQLISQIFSEVLRNSKNGKIIVALIAITLKAPDIANVVGYTTASLQQEMFRIRSRERAQAKEKEITNTPPSAATVIYRYGGTNPGNFVPSPRDVATNSGLSFLTSPPPPGIKASVTTIEALNATGVVRAYQDKPGHVRVDPVIGTLADWRAGGSEHPCTIAVRSVVVKWDGGN